MIAAIILGLLLFFLPGLLIGAELQKRRWDRWVGYWKDREIETLRGHVAVLQERVKFWQQRREVDDAWRERSEPDRVTLQ